MDPTISKTNAEDPFYALWLIFANQVSKNQQQVMKHTTKHLSESYPPEKTESQYSWIL